MKGQGHGYAAERKLLTAGRVLVDQKYKRERQLKETEE